MSAVQDLPRTRLARLAARLDEREAGLLARNQRWVARGERQWWVAALGCLVAHAVWQAHGWAFPAFMNRDVAGIVYNARLLLAGSLPYVDSLEVKPPGAFLVVLPWLWLGGLPALWFGSVLWGAATSLATGALARAVYGRAWFLRAALLHAGIAPVASDGDINYTFWMTLPFVVAAALACSAPRQASPRRYLAWWAAAGANALLAVSIKPSAAPLLLLFAALFVRELLARRARHAALLVVGGTLGALGAAGLLALPFAMGGKLSAVASGYQYAHRFASEYVGIIIAGSGGGLKGLLWSLWMGARCVSFQLPFATSYALAGAVPLLRWGARAEPGRPAALGGWFVLATLAGVSLTLRFYTHDCAQLAPALAVLAVRPGGLLGTLLERAGRISVSAGALAASLGLWATLYDLAPLQQLQLHLQTTDWVVQRACAEVSAKLGPSDTVFGWDWASWSVYEHCGRSAPSPLYKSLSLVTSVNANTCNQGFGRIELREGELAQQLLAALEAAPPALIVWSDYYLGMGGDPLDDWPALNAFIERHYRIARGAPPYVIYERRDLSP